LSSPSNEEKSAHGLLLLGIKKVYACHLAMFSVPAHQYQAILEVELTNKNDMDIYLKTMNENPTKPLIIMNTELMLFRELANSSSFSANLFFANDNGDPDGDPIIQSTIVKVKKQLLFKHLNPTGDNYPENFAYYLYGVDSEYHLSHVITKAPNFQQEIDVTIEDGDDMVAKVKSSDPQLIRISIPSLNEKSSQPITKDPLIDANYAIIETEGDNSGAATTTGKISILRKFWINNGPLNSGLHDMNMHHMDAHA